jgi:septum site-determining protein MinD
MVKRGDMLSIDDVLDVLAIDLIGIVPEDEQIVIGSNRGTPVALDEKSRAGQAFRNIARRLKGEQVPFMDLDKQDGFLNRLGKLMRPGG